MSQVQCAVENRIAFESEHELWQSIRDDTRRRLARATSIGFLYLLAALAVGAYLILAVREYGTDAIYFDGWYPKPIQFDWLTQIAWAYGVIAIVATFAYILVMLFIFDRLPSTLCRVVAATPWIGSTIRIVATGELCQSVFRSILDSKSYSDALQQASHEVHNRCLRDWSALSAARIDAGHSLANVMRVSPFQDPPLSAIAALTTYSQSQQESLRIWYQATTECHRLAQSRLDRATTALSVTCLLVSVFLASFAMFLTALFTRFVLGGLTS
ncbi:hypothetical protein NHH03_26900 [Stieleria sp. TO1_6]|uniref:hypothetical protein n=1 Tax=Stieleria tagensis TaxID=2956795 RepID=UPI00209ADA96|nr:hypothetical protein [Stieleria tagensis]MCO8125397.1 hypothetical protein [Stieleria tagensis]